MATTTVKGQKKEAQKQGDSLGLSFFASQQNLSDKQTRAFNDCLKSFCGFTYKETEEVLYELLAKIKTTSLIA